MSKSSLIIPLPVPARGLYLFQNPMEVPPDGALQLSHLDVDDGVMRSRDGYSSFLDVPNANLIVDIFNLRFNDGLTRALRCTAATGTAGATSPIHYDTFPTWSAVTLDNTFGASGVTRFWAVTAPWASSTRGRIILSNNIKIKSWTGTAIDTMSDVAGGFPSKFGIVGPDGRLIIANILEGGVQQMQRIRGTVVALVNGGATDWTDPGSFAYDLRSDSYPITGLFMLRGQIFIGKEYALMQMLPTGNSLDPYSFSILNTNGQGLFIPHSLVQYGNYAIFFTHDDIVIFDGVNLTPIGGPIWRTIFKRLNMDALEHITVEVDREHKRIVWGLPLDGSVYPSAMLKLKMSDMTWSLDAPMVHTALASYTGVDPTTYGELPGLYANYAALAAKTYGALTPLSTPQAKLVIGRFNGITVRSDPTSSTDFGSGGVVPTFQTAAIPVLGKEVIVAGRPRLVDIDDQLVLDEVILNLLDRGSSYTLFVQASRDNGRTWTVFGNVSMTTQNPPANTAFLVQKRLYGRFACGDTVMLKMFTAPVKWGFAGGVLKLDLVGRRRKS